MKPFSKMAAIGEGKPVVSRSGKKLLQIHEFSLDIKYPIAGVLEGSNETDTWTSDGRYSDLGGVQHPKDLFMAATPKEGWVAFGVYKKCGDDLEGRPNGFATHVWPTKEKAKADFRSANNGTEAAGTVRVEWES